MTNLLPVYHFLIKASFYLNNAPVALFKWSPSSSGTSVSPQQLKKSLSRRSEHDKCLYSGAPSEIVLKREINIELGELLHAAICEGCQKQTHNTFPIPTAGKQGQMLMNTLAISLYKQVPTTGRNCSHHCITTATQIKANVVVHFLWPSHVLLV